MERLKLVVTLSPNHLQCPLLKFYTKKKISPSFFLELMDLSELTVNIRLAKSTEIARGPFSVLSHGSAGKNRPPPAPAADG